MKARTHNSALSAALLTAVLLLCQSSAQAEGETIAVNTVEDVVDFGGMQEVLDLPGPDGAVSFREACMAANNTAGPQTIAFNIPVSEWWFFDDRAILRLEDGLFAITDDETFIDFSTQTEFSGDTNPDGNEVGIYGLQPNGWGVQAIWIEADNCTVKGLDAVMQRGYAVSIQGNNNRVIGSTIWGPIHAAVEINGLYGAAAATGNTIGGTEPGEGNVLSGGGSGVRIAAPADDNVVIGNQISGGDIGVWILASIYTPTVNNNRIGGPTPEERNVIAGAGSYCCEGAPSGGQVLVEYGAGNIIEGNYIGTTPDGLSAEPQIGPVGVRVHNSNDTIVRNNVIGGIVADGFDHYAGQRFGVGVQVRGQSNGTIIQGNRIGINANETAAIANYKGIEVTQIIASEVPTNTLIGGAAEAEGNLIAFSQLDGIRVSSIVSGVSITGNNIFENDLLGIDLLQSALPPGPTPNDPGDGDQGANGLQNFPILSSAYASPASINITGTIDSTPNSVFAVEFFSNTSCDPSGFGEGESYLGSASVATDSSGLADFAVDLAVGVESDALITATATNLVTGSTSEFSLCQSVESGSPADVNGDGVVNVSDLLDLLASWGACPQCSEDIDGNNIVDVVDLLMLLANWS